MIGHPERFIGPAALAGAASIWGSMYVVSAVILRIVPAFVLLELRFAIALVVLGALARREGAITIARSDLRLMALLGLVGYTGSIGLQFIGTALSGAALGSLITAAAPALIALFAVWLLGERLTAVNTAALVLGLIGIVVVVGLPSQSTGGTLTGNLALAGAALTWAAYTVLGRLGTRRYGSLTVTTWATAFGVLFSFPIAVVQQITHPWLSQSTPGLWLGVLYLGTVCTAGGFFLWNKGFEYLPAGTGGLYLLAQPLVGTILGWALLGERPGLTFILGAVLIVAGVSIATLGARRTPLTSTHKPAS